MTEVDVPVKFVKIEGDNHLPLAQSTLDSMHEFFSKHLKEPFEGK